MLPVLPNEIVNEILTILNEHYLYLHRQKFKKCLLLIPVNAAYYQIKMIINIWNEYGCTGELGTTLKDMIVGFYSISEIRNLRNIIKRYTGLHCDEGNYNEHCSNVSGYFLERIYKALRTCDVLVGHPLRLVDITPYDRLFMSPEIIKKYYEKLNDKIRKKQNITNHKIKIRF